MATEPIDLAGAAFLKAETAGLYEPHGSRSLGEATQRSSKHNRGIAAAIPYWQEWREQANRIKAYAIANLDKLLVQFEQTISARGAVVLYARDAAEANRHVLRIAEENGVHLVAKAKTMVSEEMELNHKLAAVGIRAVETDLGEYLVQLAGQRPVHIVTPALHMSAADVGHLFAEKLGEPFTAEHRKLTDIARRHLRDDFLKADMGVSGVNFAVADTGTICVVENEGNGGLSTSTPRVHVALMGIEKVIPRFADLPLFLNLLARSGTGQKLTAYTHLFHGATPGRKLYVIIIDNGRTNVLKDPATRIALACIRCGACLNACPVYRRTGGWAYGWVYPGPIGAIITPHMIGMKQAGTLPFASSLCGACGEVCPVKIDIPHQLVHLRHEAVNQPSPARSLTDRITWKLWAWAMSGPRRYRLAMAGVRLGVGMARFLPWHPGKLGAWTRGRELPALPGRAPFRTWWRRKGRGNGE
jgi:L-lactate dehydrogenase complex protein LldF